MTNQDNPLIDAGKELHHLRQEVARLQQYKKALEANRELMSNFMTMIQSASGRLLTRAMLQQTLQIATNLTKADESSIFLLDPNGVVQESLLARGAVMREEKNTLIGQVLREGLAGWVYQNRKTAVLIDTRLDSRWINLPGQPYTTLSALCLPLIRGRSLLGIITLTHSQVAHFTPEITELMEIVATQMGLVFDQMRFYLEKKLLQVAVNNHSDPSSKDTQSQIIISPEPAPIAEKTDRLADLGLYIITQEGIFVYADPKFAETFGYTLGELVGLESFFDLAIPDNRVLLKQRITECFRGKNPQLSVKFQGLKKNSEQLQIKLHGRKTKLFGKNLFIGFVKGN